MKKIAAALILCLMMPLGASASFVDDFAYDNMLDEQGQFNDVPTSHMNNRAINFAIQEGIIQGYDDGTFKPDGTVNRAELVKMVVADYFEIGEMPDPEVYKNCFPDVTTEWFAPYICYALENEWIQGYDDGTFKPANAVNRVEGLKMLFNISLPADEWPDPTEGEMGVEMPTDLDMNQWYAPFVRIAIVKNLVDGQHVIQDDAGNLYYYPGDGMTRKEVVEVLYRIVVWVVERDSYGQAMADLGCFQVMNEVYAESLSEEEQNEVVYQIFEIHGWDRTETDATIEKYYYDTVGDTKLEMYTQEKCGEGVEYDNWIYETFYANEAVGG